MWTRTNSQEVGLEAATLRRVRNSSLVERVCAENDTGLSMPPKPQDSWREPWVGRGAFPGRGRHTARNAGAPGSEDAGISSDKRGGNPRHRKPKGSLSNVRRLRVSRA